MNLEGILQSLQEVLREPSSNLTVAALLAAIVTLLLLLLVVALIAWALRPLPSPEGAAGERSPLPPSRKPRSAVSKVSSSPAMTTAMGVTIALLVLASIAIAYVRTASLEYCVDLCHAGILAEDTEPWPHESVSCVSCHENAAVSGAISAVAFRFAHPYFRDPDTPSETVIGSERCLRCHGSILTTVLVDEERALRMSHAEPIESGLYCSECHSEGHETSNQIARMPVCIRCHDGEAVDSDCDVCHIGDPALSTRNRRLFATEVILPEVRDCAGCHDQVSCDDCHGIRMPHSTDFVDGGHAMQAAFDRKPLCYRCHLENDCGPCHADWGAHGPNFKAEHKDNPRGANCGGCHREHTGSFCARCHGEGW